MSGQRGRARHWGTLLINGDARVELGGDAGEATIPGSPDIGENKIGLNPRYLVDIAKVFGGPVTMNYDAEPKGSRCPVTFRSDAMPGYVAVQMPMRV